MHKRPLSDSEVLAEEADSSEISKPATKIIRIDDSPKSSSDKCIQVDSATESSDLPGPSNSAITTQDDIIEEDNAVDLVSSNTNHTSASTSTTTLVSSVETTTRCSIATDDPSTITTTSATSSSSIDDTSDPNSDIVYLAPTNDQTSESPNSTEPTSSIEEVELQNEQPLNEDEENAAAVVVDTINDDSISGNIIEPVATTSDVSPDEPDMTPSTSTGIRHDTRKKVQSILKAADRQQKPKGKRSVIFNGDCVTVYYFRRSQGFTCIPSQGGSTLGMENSHTFSRNFTLETHAEERKRVHREILQRQRRFAKMNKHSSTSESEDDSYDDMSDLSDIDLENDNCYFLQPVPVSQRRALLRASGVRKIETSEKEECKQIRTSREFCGCDCEIYCNPEMCACYLAGIKCQVDRISFPCGCSRDGCNNDNGRIEFNPIRVRTHFIHTIMKIEMEKKQVRDYFYLTFLQFFGIARVSETVEKY